MISSCKLVPEKIQLAVNAIADGLLIEQLKIFILEILKSIQRLIICVTGIDIVVLLKYLTILAVVVWLYNLVVSVVSNYLCWFKCRKSRSSSSSSSCSSSDSSSCSC